VKRTVSSRGLRPHWDAASGRDGRCQFYDNKARSGNDRPWNDVPIKKCPMCLETKDVVSSHLIPAAMYAHVKGPEGHHISVTPDVIIESDRQVQFPLLCLACEKCLNEGGEDWLLPLLARLEGPFPFYDLVVKHAPVLIEKDAKYYATARNPDIDCDKLIHFGLGIFFKAAVHSWSGSRTEPSIDLGRYCEGLRTYLRRETEFPERMSLTVAVLPAPVKEIVFCFPYRDSTEGRFSYRFYGLGIQFILGVGKGVTKEQRSVCFAPSPHRPIIITDFSDGVRMPFREAYKTTRKAQNVMKWLKKP
jgi:hypothetical protein